MKGKTGLIVIFILLNLSFFSLKIFGEDYFHVTNASVTYRDIQIYVNGKLIGGEEPFILNSKNVIMVPVRTVAEAIGKTITWDEEKNTINIASRTNPADNKEQQVENLSQLGVRKQSVQVTYRNIQIYNGPKSISGEEPFILNSKGIVMVPLRTILEATGEPVSWDGKNNAVYIGTIPAKLTNSQVNQTIKTPPSVVKVDLQDMTVLRNIGPFFQQKRPFSIVTGKYDKGIGVRLSEESAEIVIRTHGKYKAMEGWLGVDDETCNSSGAFFFSVFTGPKEVPSVVVTDGGAEKIIDEQSPREYGFEYRTVDLEFETLEGGSLQPNINQTIYPVNSNLYEKNPVFLSGPIYPASYPKYISPAMIDISGALTVTIRVTWTAGEKGDYPDLTAVLADFKFIK